MERPNNNYYGQLWIWQQKQKQHNLIPTDDKYFFFTRRLRHNWQLSQKHNNVHTKISNIRPNPFRTGLIPFSIQFCIRTIPNRDAFSAVFFFRSFQSLSSFAVWQQHVYIFIYTLFTVSLPPKKATRPAVLFSPTTYKCQSEMSQRCARILSHSVGDMTVLLLPTLSYSMALAHKCWIFQWFIFCLQNPKR